MQDRINKYLAERLGVSRREADDLIASGRVMIDDAVAIIGARVNESQAVTVDGKPIARVADYIYVMFHKPVGYVCSRRAQGDAPTIYDVLPEHCHSLKTVGRLDKDSSGLIILTNDGDFTHRMTHPSQYKRKVYEVVLDAPLQPLHRQMISDYGVMLEDGKSQFELERLEIDDAKLSTRSRPSHSAQSGSLRPSSPSDTRSRQLPTSYERSAGNAESSGADGYSEPAAANTDTAWRVIMSEGRNRQIRRTFAALGYNVVKLHRTHFGDYQLGELPVGETTTIQL